MGNSWQTLLDSFHKTLAGDYRSDSDRDEAMMDQLVFTMQRILEKLRDAEDMTDPVSSPVTTEGNGG